MSNEFVARKGLIIQNIQSGTTESDILAMSSSTGLITHRNDLVIDNIRFEFRDVDYLSYISDTQQYILDFRSDYVYLVSAITLEVNTGTTIFNLSKRELISNGPPQNLFSSNQIGTSTLTRFLPNQHNTINVNYQLTLILYDFTDNPTLIRGSVAIIKRPGSFTLPSNIIID